MRRLLAIAVNTYREAIRDRILYSLLFFAVLVLAASLATQEITVYLRNLAVARRLRSIMEAQALDYRIDSTVYTADGNRSTRRRLAREGRLALEDFNLKPQAKETP